MEGSYEDFTRDQRDSLVDVLTWEHPLGPSNAQNIQSDDVVTELLFQRENAIYTELLQQTGIIVGRRGSGKTAFMNQIRHTGQHRYVVFFKAYDLFPELMHAIGEIFGSTPPLPEVVGRLWDIIVWCAIFAELLRPNHSGGRRVADARLRVVRDFANWLELRDDDCPELVAQKVIDHLRDRVARLERPVDSALRLEQALILNQEISYKAAYEAACRILTISRPRRSPAPVLILMDTLERYQDVVSATYAINGLLNYLGSRDFDSRKFVDVRFCLPAELYLDFMDLSSSPIRDFTGQTLLHWSSGDLLRIVAHRIALYLKLHEPSRLTLLLETHDIGHRSGAVAFCEALLPTSIHNSRNEDEPTLAYMLRHTQLLPRHIIDIFNNALRSGISRETGVIGPIAPGNVVNAVLDSEARIAAGIIQAYEHKYPKLRDACAEVIPNLPRAFHDSRLEDVFNRHAKQISGGEYRDFKRMLIEAGVIGKSAGKVTAIYHEAEFEYTTQGKLVVANTDALCLHPLFSTRSRSTTLIGGEDKPIFPRGSDPTVADDHAN